MMKLKAKNPLTVAMITKDAEETINRSLESAVFAGQILILDENSEDKTVDIALKYTDQIITTTEKNFAKKRNRLLEACQTDWILYLDADEVISEALKNEIMETIKQTQVGCFALKRRNFFLGKRMYPDEMKRLFLRDRLRGWTGKLHESPIVIGPQGRLNHPLDHYTHRDIFSMLSKTNEWSELEADLRIEAKHPEVKWWRLVRMAITTLWHQIIDLGLWRYGRRGWFEAYFQIIDKLVVYTKLWERQHVSKN